MVPALKSVTVLVLMESALIASEKVALTFTPGPISVAPAAGKVLLTLGAWVSAGVSAQSGNVEPPSVVSRLTVVSAVVCALAARTNTSPTAKSIAPPLSWLVVAEAVSSGGGRVVGAGIAKISVRDGSSSVRARVLEKMISEPSGDHDGPIS